MITWPYWPRPPVWRTNLPWIFSTGLPIVSRYATCGRPPFASTLNSRLSRSTMISRCSSPMPAISVWPVSSSLRARTELVLVGLGLRLDRDGDDRIGEGHRLELDRRRVGGERVARRRVLEA